MSKTPFFIIGHPRSGTTLLRLILNAHPEIVVPPECGFIHWWYKTYKDGVPKGSEKRAIAEMLSSKKMETWMLDVESVYSCLQGNTYQDLCYAFIAAYQHKFNKEAKFWGDKNNYYVEFLKEILDIYPNAKFIFLIRDIKAVVASCIKVNELPESKYKPKFPSTVEKLGEYWLKSNLEINKFKKDIDTEASISITYENLVLQPEKELQKIVRFLGAKEDYSCLSYYLNPEQLEPSETSSWKKQTNHPITSEPLNRYKKSLTMEEVSLLESMSKTLEIIIN